MDALELKYDSAYDSWVLEPIHVPNTRHRTIPSSDRRHSSAETFASSAASARNSCSSAAPLRRSFSQKRWSPAPRHLTNLARNDNGQFWKSLKRYWTCLKPPTDHNHHHHNQHSPHPHHHLYQHSHYHQTHHHHHAMRPPKKEKQRIESCSNALAKTDTLTTYYTTMSAEERDENLKAVVLYCKSTSS